MFGLFDLGKKKRQKVFTQLLEDAYYNHYDEILTNNDVYFEAGLKFAEENSESKPYKSDRNNIVFRYIINNELLSVYFSKSFDGGLTYSVKLVSDIENYVNKKNMNKDNSFVDNQLEKSTNKINSKIESPKHENSFQEPIINNLILNQLLGKRLNYVWICAILCGIIIDKFLGLFIILIPLLCLLSLINAIKMYNSTNDITFKIAFSNSLLLILPLGIFIGTISYLIVYIFK